MTRFSVASFNLENLVGPEREYYRHERLSREDYARRIDWLAGCWLAMDADILCLQEVFDPEPLQDLVEEVNRRSRPPRPWRVENIRWAANANDATEEGYRRPGLAIVSRLGFSGPIHEEQVLETPLEIGFRNFDGTEAGRYTLSRLSRPVMRARIPVAGRELSVFNLHLKSQLGEYLKPEGAEYPPEADLLRYDAFGRALGEARAAMRRMAEALTVRRMVLEELEADRPTVVCGDFNDVEAAVSSRLIAGERAALDYATHRRHDAEDPEARYGPRAAAAIEAAMRRVRLVSAEALQRRASGRDLIYTVAFGGVRESIDRILLSHHFDPDDPGRSGGFHHLAALTDHLALDGGPAAEASDHAPLVATLSLDPA